MFSYNNYIFLIFLFSFKTLFSQEPHLKIDISCDTSHYEQNDYIDSLEYYKKKFGSNCKLHTKDEKLKLAFFVAISHYPELRNTKISMHMKKIPSTMQAQPYSDFLFRKKGNRKYKVIVNKTSDVNGMYYKDLSFNSLVGWIGHEFAHILDYTKMNNGDLISFIASYVFDKDKMKKTERKADKETIKHGLGIQLLDGANYFHRNKKISRKHKPSRAKHYQEYLG